MSLPIYVDAYSGYKAYESPRQFCLDEAVFQIEMVEDQWRSPDATFFKVRTTDGKRCVLRYVDQSNQWTLQSNLDGAELLARTSIHLVTVEPTAIREAESRIAACEHCRLSDMGIFFDSILADVLDLHGAYEFVLAEPARCPNCRGEISEKTQVELQGGIEVGNIVLR